MESMGISDITFDSRIVRCSSAGHKFDATGQVKYCEVSDLAN
jgi:hypothetical protein